MADYTACSDDELIEQLRVKRTSALYNDSERIMDYILDKYKPLVRKRANALYLIGGDTDDLIQEGMIGLFKAVQNYRKERDSSFYHFAKLCIERQMYTAVEASQRKKHAPLNTYIPLDARQEKDGAYLETGSHPQTSDPETLFISQETIRLLLKQASERLSPMEHQVLVLYLDGMNYHQIAEHMGKTPKAVDNALQRIRGKIR